MYHTVRIRDLEPLPPVEYARQKSASRKRANSFMPAQFWEESIDGVSDFAFSRHSSKAGKYRQTYFEANGPHTHIVPSGHPVFEAYLAAYNAHEDLILSPDDIWLMITIYYSRYVVDHAEQMRNLFVSHEGKKELVVEINEMKPNWPLFLTTMRSKIGSHVKNNVVDLLTSNFSTTGPTEALLSSACIMHTFQKYFDFTQMVCGCGIRNVHFMGTVDDWKLLRKKVEELKMFTVPPSSNESAKKDFRLYLDGVLPILDQFIRTYEGNVDNDFWDTIFDYTKIGIYGPSGIPMTVDGVRGWFLRLCFGCHLDDSKGVELSEIGLGAISVPVKLVDLVANEVSLCYVVGGFHGIHSSEDGKHRPVMSFAIFQEVDKKSSSKETIKTSPDSASN